MFNPGDILRVQYPGFAHYGIYVGNNRVIHNAKAAGRVQEVTLDEFSDGRRVTPSGIQPDDPRLAIEKARKYLGLSYRLFSRNCEHFVRTVAGLVKESTQVQKYAASTLGLGALLVSDNPAVKAAGAGAAIGTLLTPKEKSPIGNALIGTLLGATLAWLASR